MKKEDQLPEPLENAIFYDSEKAYACLASYPIVRGHSIVVWKKPIADLHYLEPEEYEQLMTLVKKVRDALLELLATDKVYLVYMDEVKHVHWHLIPRTSGESGFTLLEHEPHKLSDFSLVEKLRESLSVGYPKNKR